MRLLQDADDVEPWELQSSLRLPATHNYNHLVDALFHVIRTLDVHGLSRTNAHPTGQPIYRVSAWSQQGSSATSGTIVTNMGAPQNRDYATEFGRARLQEPHGPPPYFAGDVTSEGIRDLSPADQCPWIRQESPNARI